MFKELIISIFIVFLIFVGDSITDNYTRVSIDEASNDLMNLREELMKDEKDIKFDIAKQKIDDIHKKWDIRYEKLAYYIEHDELEKVETELTGLRSYIENEEYSEAVAELDKSVYILEHIKNKSSFNLRNIF